MSRIEKRHKCSVCEKRFVLFSSLKIHELNHNDRERLLKRNISSDVEISEVTDNDEDKCSDDNDEEIGQVGAGLESKPLQCSACGETYTHHNDLKLHMDTHKFSSKHNCTLCSKNFSSLKALNWHIKKHILRKKLKCPNCNKGFSSHRSYTRHVHQGEVSGFMCKRKFMCKICSKIFPSNASLEKHAAQSSYRCSVCKQVFSSCKHAQEHKKSHALMCNACGKKFSCRMDLNEHRLTHKTEELSCLDCSKKFKNLYSLSRHIRRVHRDVRDVQCEFCGKLFYKRLYKIHLRTHTGERPYKCKECGSAFVQRIHLVRHMKSHSGEKNYHCDICSKAFSTKQSLTLHYKTHMGENPYSCNTSSKSFKQLSKVQQSSRVVNDRHACKICGKEYTYIHLIYSHYRSHSQDELQMLDPETLNALGRTKSGNLRKMHCKFCEKIFNSLSDLQAHMKIHADEKPHICSVCGKAFGLKHNLKLHEKIHTGERPFSCKICSKSFVRLDHARSHVVIHMEEKPFTCHECGRTFSRKSQYNLHQQIHSLASPTSSTNVKSFFTCSNCGKAFKMRRKYVDHWKTCSQTVGIPEIISCIFSDSESSLDENGELDEMNLIRKSVVHEVSVFECGEELTSVECIPDLTFDNEVDFQIHVIDEVIDNVT